MGRVDHRVALVALCALTAASPRLASADDVGVVVARPLHASVGGADLEAAVAAGLGDAGHLVVFQPIRAARARVAAGAVRAVRLVAFSRADALLRDGWRSYALGDFAAALAKLTEARALAVDIGDLDGGVELVAEVSLRLGVVKHEQLDVSGAAAEFRLARRLAPERVVTDDEFKPLAVGAFRSAVAAPVSPRSVNIRREPAAASLIVDGREVASGATRIDLDVGFHLVVGRAPGMAPSRALVDISSAAVPELAIRLELDAATAPLESAELGIGVGEGVASRAGASALFFGELDAVLITAAIWRGGAPALVGQWCDGVPLECGRAVEIRFADRRGLGVAVSELIRRARAETRRFPLTVLGDARLTDPESPDAGIVRPVTTPWWKNRWLWIGVGSAIAVGGATALILTRDPGVTLEIEADPCEFGPC